MCFDDFPLAGEAEVAGVLLHIVQLHHTHGKVAVGKAHPLEGQNVNPMTSQGKYRYGQCESLVIGQFGPKMALFSNSSVS